MRKPSSLLLSLVVLACLCLALVPAVSAFTATLISPSDGSTVYPGTVIKINITGLTTSDKLTYRLSSTDLYIPGNTVTLPTTSLPFSFKDGLVTTSASTTGISAVTFTVTKDGGAAMTKSGSSITTQYNIKSGNYDVSATGTHSGGNVGIDYSVAGTVDTGAPDPAPLNFTVSSDLYSGHLTIQVLQDTTAKLSSTFVIAPTPTQSGGGGGGGGGPAPAPAPAPAPVAPVQQQSVPLAVSALITLAQGQANFVSTPITGGMINSATTIDLGSGGLGISGGTIVIQNTGTTYTGPLGAGAMNLGTIGGTGIGGFSGSGSGLSSFGIGPGGYTVLGQVTIVTNIV
ncbi:MAG: hypothetical protein WC586_13580 [Methanoregula sp.]